MVDGVRERPQLKIEIPANRYDMLCIEGIALNLNVFRGRMTLPHFKLVPPSGGKLETMIVHESVGKTIQCGDILTPQTTQVRPLVSCAILRNIKFTKERYDSFISLQDKLHANLARQRTLVSIGTHDLDTIKGPFHYAAETPEKIKFIPLNQTKEINAAQLMTFYEKDKHLNKFLHIIRDKPVYPVIRDASGTVLSLPPIINGEHSKITLKTVNVLIEITAVDKAKVEIVNKILVAMFSRYCAEPFTVEPVRVESPHNGETRMTPDLAPRAMTASVAYINSCTGLALSAAEQSALLRRMGIAARADKADDKTLQLAVAITRADVLHQADVMEDVAVAYGFNKLPRHYAPSAAGAAAVGAALPLNKLADITRHEAARAGWREALPLILCSHDENFAWLRRPDDGTRAVRPLNPKSAEYQVVRTSLVPGLLKTVRENRHRPLPVKIFEASDVVLKDGSKERKTRNERRFAAAFCGKTSGFEVVHGLLDRLMLTLGVPFLVERSEHKVGYWIENLDRKWSAIGLWALTSADPTFFEGHAASIHVNVKDHEGKLQNYVVGEFGILHPAVLKNFELV